VSSRSLQILLVDDNDDLRESLTEALEDKGYTVATACDGLVALAHLGSAAAERPDLILLDLMMPRMNGLQFREEQLSRTEYAKIPVVVLTGDSHMREKVHSLGVAGFISKPVVVDTLLETVARVLRDRS
jgi:CheY-like chemotaxis protein